jgi:hypothetical protein
MKFSLGLLLFMTAAAFGQVQSTVVSGSATRNAAGQFSGSMSFSPMRFAQMPVQGAPYSGEEIQEQQQTLSDGTHINRTHMRRMMYRDSQGRTRAERPMMPMMVASNGGQAPQIVEKLIRFRACNILWTPSTRLRTESPCSRFRAERICRHKRPRYRLRRLSLRVFLAASVDEWAQ